MMKTLALLSHRPVSSSSIFPGHAAVSKPTSLYFSSSSVAARVGILKCSAVSPPPPPPSLGERMEKIEHKMVAVNGLNMHVAELGQGPTVLFLHGFPQLWYSWRHQILYLGQRGYRAVAPDLRGYGDTTGAPIDDLSKFSIFHLVGDLIALLEAIAPNEDKVFVVGHNWGAIIAWHLCLFRPDKVKALVNLSVHHIPRNPLINIVDGFTAVYGKDYFMSRFQVPGDIEAEFAPIGARTILAKYHRYRDPAQLKFPKGKGVEAVPDAPIALSSWFSEEDLDYFASKFVQTGFTGGINYYRALPLNWELTAPWTGALVKVPVKFMVGEFDFVYHLEGAKEYIHSEEFKKDVPLLEEVVVLEGAAHYINQEKPDEINKHIYDFFQKF